MFRVDQKLILLQKPWLYIPYANTDISRECTQRTQCLIHDYTILSCLTWVKAVASRVAPLTNPATSLLPVEGIPDTFCQEAYDRSSLASQQDASRSTESTTRCAHAAELLP
jgi:hypothetical protein